MRFLCICSGSELWSRHSKAMSSWASASWLPNKGKCSLAQAQDEVSPLSLTQCSSLSVSHCVPDYNGDDDLRGDAKLVLLGIQLVPFCSVFTDELCLISGFLGSSVGSALLWPSKHAPHSFLWKQKERGASGFLVASLSPLATQSPAFVPFIDAHTWLVSHLKCQLSHTIIKEGENFLTLVTRWWGLMAIVSDKARDVPLLLTGWLLGPRIQTGFSSLTALILSDCLGISLDLLTYHKSPTGIGTPVLWLTLMNLLPRGMDSFNRENFSYIEQTSWGILLRDSSLHASYITSPCPLPKERVTVELLKWL